ncbi:hypothetical protein TraAM80_00835 [Trypanosoma rangeli]|uniref:Uncharacterized protein n=1 Tax=Trypanosoma rangeli TaxID=5698 RepID=A0A3R7KQJ1_TRYRA|nr:uncharacterized protein TraAM80_00835 [Trypanosoma rangeli]RNF11639.1 hypothetical protein TraAM80_00835 [Trypanosoma rangeli]|eukprot:RNF11639.1 hypothetical protein TraAM80_00835 [Trypanosoma rangeli]
MVDSDEQTRLGDTQSLGPVGTQKSLSDSVSVKECLLSRIKDGFASSAYWGATGEVPPREPDDVARKKPHTFEMEISKKLVPFPEEKTSLPRTLDYTHVGFHRLKGDGSEVKPQLNAAQLRHLGGSGALTAKGSGSETKPRLMETTTTQNRTIGNGTFDPEVIDALSKGMDMDTFLKERDRLKNMPLEGPAPDCYRPTSWDYCDMSGIDRSSYWVMQKDPNAPDSDGLLPVYKSRYNLVEKEGPVRRGETTKMLERGNNVDKGLLKDTMNGMNTKGLPEGYQPWSAQEWMSTTHDCHAPYDVARAAATNARFATAPLPRTYHDLTPAHEQTVLSLSQRYMMRHARNWATEYSDSYMDRLHQAEVNKDHSKRSIFDLQNGIYTMHHSAHHPRDDTATGEMYTPSQVVPGQHTTMSEQPFHARNALRRNETSS